MAFNSWSVIETAIKDKIVDYFDGDPLIKSYTVDGFITSFRSVKELLEIDRPTIPIGETTNSKIRNGIEFEDEGVPRKYYALKDHPEDFGLSSTTRNNFEEIDAFNTNGTKKVLHLYNPIRPEQTRGFSEFSACLKGYYNFDRYVEGK